MISCVYGGVSHTTWSDIFPFLIQLYDHVHRQCTLIQIYYVLVYNDVIYMPCHAEQIYRFDANE